MVEWDGVARVLAQPMLRLVGLHCHLGSQITRVDVYEWAARKMAGLLVTIAERYGVVLGQLNLGGGHAIRYLARDSGLDLARFANRVLAALRATCTGRRLTVPRLTVEPGRPSLVRPPSRCAECAVSDLGSERLSPSTAR
jgi:diaminopimelate decarboxylase